jgi:hypothetical protein
MKMSIKLLIVSLLITVSFCNEKFLEAEGSASNFGEKATEAVSYSLAKVEKVKGVFVTNDKRFKDPVLVEKLPLRKPIETGGPEMIDELPSPEDYYDGQKGIRMSMSVCQQYTTKPQACVAQGNCGWCMGSGSCVDGTKKGPITENDCMKGKYVFDAPNKDWNPLIKIANTKLARNNIMGAQLTTITEQP